MSANPIAPPQPATLSNDEILRYSRHLIMPEVGMEGQLKLKQAKVLMIGTGLRRLFFRDRSEELLSLVFFCCDLD